MKTIIIKEKTGAISFFEITPDNEIIYSGSRWKEKKNVMGLPIYGSLRTGNLGTPERARKILDEIIKLIS